MQHRAPDARAAQDGREEIRRGFVWLGAASAIGRVLDVASVFIVLWFVSSEELGQATLAWSVAVMLEALNGLGVGAALVQAGPKLGEREKHSAFWYAMGAATLLILVVFAAAGLLSSLYDSPPLAAMLRVSVTKLWFVGAAVVPLAMLNRELRYERIAAVSTAATLGSSVLTCVLAALGFGAWALVLGQTSHGLITMLGAFWAHDYRPRLVFDRLLLAPLARFGGQLAASSVLYHFYRNVDYFILGRMLDVSAVGMYRVAFDLAMTPTLAILTVVNRAAVPVYARLHTDLAALKSAFLWTLSSLGLLLVPLTVVLGLNAEDLLSFVKDGEWAEAAPIVPWLCAAALLRCLDQTFPQVFQGLRRPAFAFYDAALSVVTVAGLIYASLSVFGAAHGAVVVAWAWLAAYPLLIVVLALLLRLLMPLSFSELLHTQRHTVGALVSMVLAHLLVSPLCAGFAAWLRLALCVLVEGAAYALYVRYVARIRVSEALKPQPRSAPTDGAVDLSASRT